MQVIYPIPLGTFSVVGLRRRTEHERPQRHEVKQKARSGDVRSELNLSGVSEMEEKVLLARSML